ncbi:hypothetical protein COC46_05945 [Bacillus sp. AFS041924]|nr:hypothetical protein COC46_05945 [Bacillus sp. AFS041924]
MLLLMQSEDISVAELAKKLCVSRNTLLSD